MNEWNKDTHGYVIKKNILLAFRLTWKYKEIILSKTKNKYCIYHDIEKITCQIKKQKNQMGQYNES